MDYKYRGTFVISGENTRLIPGKGYEVYHCDRVRSLLDDINKKGKSMYAKIQEIQFPDDLDWSIRCTEWSPLYVQNDAGDPNRWSEITNTVTFMAEINMDPSWVEPPEFLETWVAHWTAEADKLANDKEHIGGMWKLEWAVESKRMAFLYYDDHSDANLNCPRHQYMIEFGTGLQYRFGLPARIGRTAEELYRPYPSDPEYRSQREGESVSQYNAYKTEAKTQYDAWVKVQRDERSRILGVNTTLIRDRTHIPPDFDEIHGVLKTFPNAKVDCWVFNCGIVDKNQLITTPPHYLYFSHADLCGNSLNLQRSTCLVDYPEGTVYDSRDEYIYVHNCSPYPNITFTAYTPKAVNNGSIEYEKYLYYPQQFYVIIDYYEA